MIVILGAGLAGLSVAYHLERRKVRYLVFDKESEVGGLCRTVVSNGYSFDFTGHLLHVRSEYVKGLVHNLLPGKFNIHKRRASVFSQNRLLDYPFQANFYKLPKPAVKECLMGFIKALINQETKSAEESLEKWALNTFGSGIVNHFFKPYNEKLFNCELKAMTSDWVSWSVPRPNLEEVINGSLGIKNRAYGYNPTFLYPKRGGIGILPQALSKSVRNLNLKQEARAISMSERKVFFHDNTSVNYSSLVSTMPLPELLKKIIDLPAQIRNLADKLKYVSVLNINVGIKKKSLSKKHWIYFPEPEFLFYRVGFYNNFSTKIVPKNCSSCYIEISYRPEEGMSLDNAVRLSTQFLIQLGFINSDADIDLVHVLDIPYGYVLHDIFRKDSLSKIQKFLKSKNIFSIGRFGAWKYNAMEDAILEGKVVAEERIKIK